MGKITIPYKPHRLQSTLHEDLKRFSVIVAHRRFGKTVLAVNHLLRDALSSTKQRYRGAYIAPLYKQAKSIAWDYLKYYAKVIPGVVPNETELRIDFPNESRIRLLGADKPDTLRGPYLDGVVLDEVAQMSSGVWGPVIRPQLADRKGWALFIGTPQGKNLFHSLYERAQADPAWHASLLKASHACILDPDELAEAKKDMTAAEYEQEFECSFEAAIRGAYYGPLIANAEAENRITRVPYDPALPVHTAWDLGMADSTAIWFVQSLRGAGEFRVIDYYEDSGKSLQDYIRVLNERGYIYGRHIAPHDVEVRELGTGKSRREVAQGLGLKFETAPNLHIPDGIQAVRDLLPKCWFDCDKCALGLEALRHYRRNFNEKLNTFHDRPVHDWASHPADAFRYFAVGFKPDKPKHKQHSPRMVVGWMGA